MKPSTCQQWQTVWRLFAAFMSVGLRLNDPYITITTHLKSNRLDLVRRETYPCCCGGMPAVKVAIDLLFRIHQCCETSAGDAITGDLYYTLLKGEADAALMNTVCFDAFALGNHEFDDGDAGLVKFLDHLHSGACKTPVLAANVKPKVGTPLAKKAQDDYIKPSIVLERGGEKIGVVGIDIVNKTVNSSNPDDDEVLDEAIRQVEIDKLKAAGVNKIVLLTHIQYANDVAMAGKLPGLMHRRRRLSLYWVKSTSLTRAGPLPDRSQEC